MVNPKYFIELWAPEMANHLWQSTLFAAVPTLLALTLRNYQARTRYWLWLAASIKFLIPFSPLLSIGSHIALPVHSQVSQPVIYSAIDQVSQPFSGTTLPNISITSATSHPSTLLPAILVAVWLCGFIAVLVFWCIQLRRVSKSVREVKPLRAGREIEILRRLSQTAKLSKPIKLLSSRNSMEPGVVGILHPVLLWPEGISQHLDDAHLEAILAHEVCHVQRRDNLTSTIHMLVEALFWFHPLVWWLEKRLINERERACDEAVLQLGKEPQVYAESILKVCEFCIESPLTCVSGITGADLKKRIVQIMKNRLRKNLSSGRKLLLAALGIAVVASPIAFGIVLGIPFYGQLLHATGPLPAFEVATIKPSQPGSPGPLNLGARGSGGFFFKNATVKDLIQFAYGIRSDDQLSGLSGWMTTDRYDIDAKLSDPDAATSQKLFGPAKFDQFRLMLQSLLTDRFNLKVSQSSKQVPIFELVVAKGGSKLKPSEMAAADAAHPGPPQPVNGSKLSGMPGNRTGSGVKVAQLAESLSRLPELGSGASIGGGRLVVDKTGLTGYYDWTLQWTPDANDPSFPVDAVKPPSDPNKPGLFTAVQEQLGLKLVPAKGPVEVLVVDHIDRPSEN
jgi:bla regulator protein BlaR1